MLPSHFLENVTMPWQYKTVICEHSPGKYSPPEDVLAQAGADNWELVCVTVLKQILNSGVSEIFYFKKQGNAEE